MYWERDPQESTVRKWFERNGNELISAVMCGNHRALLTIDTAPGISLYHLSVSTEHRVVQPCKEAVTSAFELLWPPGVKNCERQQEGNVVHFWEKK